MDDFPPRKQIYYYTSGEQSFHASVLYCKLVKPPRDVVGVAIAGRGSLQAERRKFIPPRIMSRVRLRAQGPRFLKTVHLFKHYLPRPVL